MRSARLTAIITFLQGVVPLLIFGAWRPGGWFLLVAAAIYVLLSYGLWTGKRWTLPLGFVLTLPQLFVVSSWLVSWRFFVGTSIGLGAKPRLDVLAMPLSFYWQVGDGFFATCCGYDAALVSSLASGPPTTVVCINAVAVCVLALLVRLWLATPNRALRRTGAGGDASSVLHA